jgi:hypothetical protein
VDGGRGVVRELDIGEEAPVSAEQGGIDQRSGKVHGSQVFSGSIFRLRLSVDSDRNERGHFFNPSGN